MPVKRDYFRVISFFIVKGTDEIDFGEKIAYGGHPVLGWMMDNIFIKSDPAENIKSEKEKCTEKIDGVVATIMALDRAIPCGLDNDESVYDECGLLLV